MQLRGGSLNLIDVSLAPAGSTVTPVDPSEPVTGEWPSFRGNVSNNGVTSAKTPISKDETVKSWSVQIGGTPTPPLMVNGKLYVLSGSTVKAIDPKTGTVTATSETLAGTSQFGTNPIAYGDGKFYIQLDANTSDEKAHVQAIDAATLKSVWVSEGFEGQLISPITYHNGYIYTGTWQQEEKTGTYFCLSTTDEDPAEHQRDQVHQLAHLEARRLLLGRRLRDGQLRHLRLRQRQGRLHRVRLHALQRQREDRRRHRHRDEPHRRPPLRRREVRQLRLLHLQGRLPLPRHGEQ